MKDNTSLQTSLQAFTLILLALDVAVYFLFKWVAIRLADPSRPRIIGSMAVLAFSILVTSWFVHFSPTRASWQVSRHNGRASMLAESRGSLWYRPSSCSL